MTFIGQASQVSAGGTLALPAATQPGDQLIFSCQGSTADARLTQVWAPIDFYGLYTGVADSGLSPITWTTVDTTAAACLVVHRNLTLISTESDPVSGANFVATDVLPVLDAPAHYAVGVRFSRDRTTPGNTLTGDSSGAWTTRATAFTAFTQSAIYSWAATGTEVNPPGTFSTPGNGFRGSGAFLFGFTATGPAPASVSRMAEQALVTGTPTARVSRGAEQVLATGTPTARVSRGAEQVLVTTTAPAARASRGVLQVLVSATAARGYIRTAGSTRPLWIKDPDGSWLPVRPVG